MFSLKFSLEDDKKFKKTIDSYTIFWLLLVSVLTIGYFALTHRNIPKLLLIMSEFFLTTLISFFFLKEDINVVKEKFAIKKIYSTSKGSYSPEEGFINDMYQIIRLFFLFFSVGSVVVCLIYSFFSKYQITLDLVVKTVDSFFIAVGAVFIFGKMVLHYFILNFKNVEPIILRGLKSSEAFKEYER